MRKEGCPEVDQYKASPSQRLQLSQSTRFRLVIENRLCTPIYKNETVETEDGGGHIKVTMYDGGNPITPDHPLASVKVDLVVIEGRFNDKRDSWSKEEFEKSIITPREGMIRLVKNGTFDLIGGSSDHQGAIIMDNSQKKEVKLGVMIAVHREERVLEGISNPFKVQEGKTKSSKKKGEKPSTPVPTQNLVQSTSTHAAQHAGQGSLCTVYPDEQHSLPRMVIEDVMEKAEDNQLTYPPASVPEMVEGNGQDLNGNGQKSSRKLPAQILEESTSAYSIQHGQVYSWAPPSIQNQLQATVNQHLLARGEDQYTYFPNGSSELAHQNPSAYASLNDIQSTFVPEDIHHLYAQTQLQETLDWSFRCGRVLLQWDNPRVEPMPLYSTNSRFYGESFPSTSLMDKTHKLLGSISSIGSVWKRPPVKKQRNAKYQLQFVNRVCNHYYTRKQIKSEDGTFLRVALYDENNMVVTSGPLSSVFVEVVLLHGDFNAEGQDYRTPEEFSVYSLPIGDNLFPKIITPVFGGDHVLTLTDGEADLGNINFLVPSSLARTGKFKMGIKIKYIMEESVQEGITSPFVVSDRLGEETMEQYLKKLKEQLMPIHMKDLEISITSAALHEHASLEGMEG
uniref:Uncharacterized protein n=1 Tax=Avena sativa TaxID=4498 RepID=A0ACD5XIY8_AVESA